MKGTHASILRGCLLLCKKINTAPVLPAPER
nr:MAG TPA: hypothetical protein [Caudoviricetes sp.]